MILNQHVCNITKMFVLRYVSHSFTHNQNNKKKLTVEELSCHFKNILCDSYWFQKAFYISFYL